jgi:hypothetical protein
MEADNDRLESKMRGAVVIDFDAAKAKRDMANILSSARDPEQEKRVSLWILAGIVALVILRFAR